jgi:hypothetical protein
LKSISNANGAVRRRVMLYTKWNQGKEFAG